MEEEIEQESPNFNVGLLSQNEQEFASLLSFEELSPLEQSPMIRIPDINVDLISESDTELESLQTFEEPTEIPETLGLTQSEGIVNSLKHISFEQDETVTVHTDSQTTKHGDSKNYVRQHCTLIHNALFTRYIYVYNHTHFGTVSLNFIMHR